MTTLPRAIDLLEHSAATHLVGAWDAVSLMASYDFETAIQLSNIIIAYRLGLISRTEVDRSMRLALGR